MTRDFDIHTLVVGREAMACRFEVACNAGEVADVTERACLALDLVEEIENRISVYRETSVLSRLNATAAADWQPLPRDVLELLVTARELHERAAGAFDIAAGALVRAWGFLGRQGRVPDDAELAAARAASGMQLVELDVAGRRVRFARPGVELNPGAIGKGWALDRMLDRLGAAGVHSTLVHGGQSSVRAIGTHGPALPGRRGWPVGLRHPLLPGRRLATITLADRALGTSGSGTRFFVDRGRRIGHILDPRSGLPAEGVISATVLAPTAAILVLPGAGGGAVRVMLGNVAAEDVVLDDGPGVEVDRGPTQAGSAAGDAAVP